MNQFADVKPSLDSFSDDEDEGENDLKDLAPSSDMAVAGGEDTVALMASPRANRL